MPPAIQAANGKFRREFLRAIDAGLKVRVSERLLTRWQSDRAPLTRTKARQPAAEAKRQAGEPHRQAELDAQERRAQGQVKTGKEVEAARAAKEARQPELEAGGRWANAERARKEAQDQEEQRQADDSGAEAERRRLAALPSEEEKAAFVRRIQELLQKASCYDGDLNGRSKDAQKALDRWIESQKAARSRSHRACQGNGWGF